MLIDDLAEAPRRREHGISQPFPRGSYASSMNSRDDAGDRGDGPDDERPRSAAIRLLGTRIVAGMRGYEADDVLRLDMVMREIEGSRTLAREVLQSLEH